MSLGTLLCMCVCVCVCLRARACVYVWRIVEIEKENLVNRG